MSGNRRPQGGGIFGLTLYTSIYFNFQALLFGSGPSHCGCCMTETGEAEIALLTAIHRPNVGLTKAIIIISVKSPLKHCSTASVTSTVIRQESRTIPLSTEKHFCATFCGLLLAKSASSALTVYCIPIEYKPQAISLLDTGIFLQSEAVSII